MCSEPKNAASLLLEYINYYDLVDRRGEEVAEGIICELILIAGLVDSKGLDS